MGCPEEERTSDSILHLELYIYIYIYNASNMHPYMCNDDVIIEQSRLCN